MTQGLLRSHATFWRGCRVTGDNVTSVTFRQSWHDQFSPLWWRVPILIWSVMVTAWSAAGFWGPPEMYFLYMTHWGLMLIVAESLVGILVTLKTPAEKDDGKQFCWRMLSLEHAWPAHFYVSCWQSGRSYVPLLFLRGFLFLFSAAVLATSLSATLATSDVHLGYWLIYMSHWGLVLVVLTTACGTAISAHAYFQSPLDATFGLPWYMKIYWVLYNITIPVAFLITVFYWCILKSSSKRVNYAPNPVLDVMLHGANSLVMLVELACSGHPSRLLHIGQPLCFALAYLLFTVGYYYAGGLDPWGNHFIYPVVDWSKPDKTIVVVTLTALFLALMHLATVAVAALRDLMARQCRKETTGVYNEGFVA